MAISKSFLYNPTSPLGELWVVKELLYDKYGFDFLDFEIGSESADYMLIYTVVRVFG